MSNALQHADDAGYDVSWHCNRIHKINRKYGEIATKLSDDLENGIITKKEWKKLEAAGTKEYHKECREVYNVEPKMR